MRCIALFARPISNAPRFSLRRARKRLNGKLHYNRAYKGAESLPRYCTMTTKEVELPAAVKSSGVFTEITVFPGLSAVNFPDA